MNKILFIALNLILSTVNSQNNQEEKKSYWTKKGVITFLVNQSTFDHWTAGGISNVSGTIALNYDFNFQKEDWTWDNKCIANFGMTKIKNQTLQKSSDQLEWNSVVGKQLKSSWYYSAFLNFKTQFADDLNSETSGPTQFFSPAYIQFGPGLLWKKGDHLKINIAPLTSRFIIVDKALTLPNNAYFGVQEGKSSRIEFGMSLGAYFKFEIMKNISIENILNLYSNYLENPENIDLDYTLNMVMTINQYISANLAYQTRYDDNAYKGIQTRQVFGIGINYDF